MHAYSATYFHIAGSSRAVCQVHLISSFPLSSSLTSSDTKTEIKKVLLHIQRESHNSQNSVVGRRTRLRILTGARDFSLLQNFQTDLGDHTVSYSVGTGIIS